jgi:hypothetical protein
MYSRLSLACLLLAGCSSSDRKATVTASPAPKTAGSTSMQAVAPERCSDDPVLVIKDGSESSLVCDDAIPKNATIVDLRDAFAPRIFAPAPDGTVPTYRASYLAAALEQDVDGKPLPRTVAYSELYGVLPSFAIVRKRFAEASRYACRAKIDSTPLATIKRPYGQETSGLFKFQLRQRELLGATLERARVARSAADFTVFAEDKELGNVYARWKIADDLYQAITTAQKYLVCEGLLAEKDVDGLFSWNFGQALDLFQRRNFLIPNARLDPETRAAFAADPRELDFKFALRVLRERVVDATGLIEDGTAGNGAQPILGRMLDPEPMRGVRGHLRPLANAAPDLISAATEAAAKQLGWTDPAATASFLAKHAGGVRVALVLPAVPAYHSAHMELSAEIDRGDVWYDDKPTQRVSWRRPSMTLFVKDGKTKRPLVRWPTTIGGWSDVRIGRGLVKRWKESDVGPRIWRDLYAAPTWLPPASTPDQELVKYTTAGKWELKKTIMGPGPLSAFGMMLLPHTQVVKVNGKTTTFEHGIGTHGSAVVTSILNGTSHGCHRLYNHLAVRLGSFLLHHRNHVVKGQQKEFYRRTVRAKGTFQAKIDTRGFLYELTPPVDVEVLPGTIRSARKIPPLASVAAGAE